MGDAHKPVPMALHLTHILRKEDGVWKPVHRDADPPMGNTTVGAAL
ncbi:MAG: hypothetical protein ACKVQT_00900 [Burkholderiales bacterium]